MDNLNNLIESLKKENDSLKQQISLNSKKNVKNNCIILDKRKHKIDDIDSMKEKYSWTDNYFKSNRKLFNQIFSYFTSNYPEIKNEDLNIQYNNILNALKNPIEVEKFIKYRFNQKSPSFANRVNKVKRLIKRLLGLKEYNLIHINVKETKKNNKKLLNERDMSLLFTALDECNSQCVYISSIFLFVYGFSFRLISRLRKRHIHLSQMIVDINNNKIRKRRKISILLTQYIISYFKNKNFQEQDLIFFTEHKDNNYILREKYIIWRITNEISITNLFIGKDLKSIIQELHSIRNTSKVKESIYLSKKFYNMEAEGQRVFSNEKNVLNKNDRSFIPLLNEQDIGQEYPEINYKIVDNNSLDQSEKDYLEKVEPSFIDFNLIDDSLYNNLFQSQILYSHQKNISTFAITEFTYNPFFLESTKKDASINVIIILNKLGIKFVDEPIFDRLNDCRAAFAKNNSHFPYLKLSNLNYYLEIKKNSIHGIYPGLIISKIKKSNYYLKSTNEIRINSLIFEVGGKIVTNKYLDENKEFLKSKNHKYFYFFNSNEYSENKNLLILEQGNIAFFIKPGTQEESNVVIKPYVKENDLVVLLCITNKIILKDEYIISDKILSFYKE